MSDVLYTDSAPMLITTLDRYDHFKECIESLQKNLLSKDTDLFIALDYPPAEKYWKGYRKIKNYLEKGIDGFKSINIIERTENYGPYRNAFDAVNRIFELYDAIIVSEDDNVFSPAFLEYINNGLYYYRDNPDVFAICGYSYEIPWSGDKSIVAGNNFFPAWGYGVQKSKYIEFLYYATLENFREYATDDRIVSYILKYSRRNFEYLYEGMYQPMVSLLDTGMCIYMIATKKYCIMPRITLSKNKGFDGSGYNATVDERDQYDNQILDMRERFMLSEFSEVCVNKNDMIIINRLNIPHEKEVRKCLIKYKIIKKIGLKRWFKVYDFLRKIKHIITRQCEKKK